MEVIQNRSAIWVLSDFLNTENTDNFFNAWILQYWTQTSNVDNRFWSQNSTQVVSLSTWNSTLRPLKFGSSRLIFQPQLLKPDIQQVDEKKKVLRENVI